jgi:epoxyqueuosine reductase
MDPRSLKQRIRDEAERVGFDRIAFAPAGPCRDGAHLQRWLSDGRNGEMAWMARDPERRSDPRRLLPEAKTVISLLTFYGTNGDPPQWRGRISRYAWGSDYHNLLQRRMRKLARGIEAAAPGSRTITAVDHRPILEKEWAERAGLGWIGKHSNLITSDRGSWFFLSELITDLELEAKERPHADRCGKCTDCIRACPTGAIVAPWEIDARRCISYLTIELKGPIPVELRPLVGEWIFGCDVCQDVCPWNRFAVAVEEPRFRLDEGRFDGELTDFVGMTEDEFLERFEGSPVRRAGRDGFVRNVCVALGNRGDAGALPALREAAEDPSTLVREHAVWAIERIAATARSA